MECMENTIIQRIREILDKYELSVTSLAKKLCMSQPTLNRQLTGENSLSLETVSNLPTFKNSFAPNLHFSKISIIL